MIRIKKLFGDIGFLFLIGFIALESGSVFQMIYASEINQLNFVILFVLFFWFLGKQGKSAFVIKKNYENLFIAIIIITSLIDILFWNELNYYILYGANIASFIICYFLSKQIRYSEWKNTFANVIFILAVLSLMGWLLRDKLLEMPYGLNLEGTWQYKSFIFFNIIKSIPIRNCGIFWEPGMYQGFLNFGIFLILMKRKLSLFDYIKVFVLGLAVITTFSTTGYVILLVLLCYFVYKNIARYNSTIASFFLISALMLFIITDGFSLLFSWAVNSLPSILTEKILNKNASFSTRIYSAVFDILLGIRYPLGVGRSSVTDLVENLAQSYSVVVTARTSTIATAFVSYGIIGGISYIFMWIRGSYRIAKRNLIEFFFVLLIMLLILNNEPMLFHLFFGTIMFYWNQDSTMDEVSSKYEEGEMLHGSNKKKVKD